MVIGAYYGSIIFILSIAPVISGVHLRCLSFIWITILNFPTAHPSLHRSLVIRRPKYIGIRLHFGEFSDQGQKTSRILTETLSGIEDQKIA